MTPFAGLVIAVVAGLFVLGRRQAVIAVTPPYLAVLAAQTAYLGSGRGTNPPEVIRGVGYWVLQILVLAAAIAIAELLGRVRARRATSSPRSLTGRHLIVAVTAATVVFGGLTGLVVTSFDHPTQGHSDGSPPLGGIIGTVACAATIAVLAVGELRARRAGRSREGSPQPSAG